MSFAQLTRRAVGTLLCAALLTAMINCSGERAGGEIKLQGAGATFPAPLYAKWVSEHGKLNPNVKIDYQSIGSGGGIQQITAGTVDFGASDAPMSDDDLKKAPGALLHIPTVLGAVVITYNLAGVTQPLRFAPDVLADIFLGKIKKWDDQRLKADNPGVALPAADITVVHRSESSGTTAVFTDYLAKVSPAWKEKPGAGKAVDWPVGLGAKGNEGVSGQIKQTPNTIGYIELAYAVQNKLPVALVKNRAGQFVEPSLDAVTAAAAETVAQMPDDLRVSITDAAGASAYPIASYTYILVYREQKDAAKGKALVDFLWWGIHDGEQFAKDLQYAPLPAQVTQKAEAKLKSITANGQPLRQT